MAEFVAYLMAFIGVSMTLYFWYKEATTDYLSENEKIKD